MSEKINISLSVISMYAHAAELTQEEFDLLDEAIKFLTDHLKEGQE